MPDSVTAPLTLGVILATVPIIWIVRHRGVRRLRHTEGKLDGLLLLLSVLCSLVVVVTTAVAISRTRSEERFLAGSRPIAAEVDRCHVVESYTGVGAQAGPSHSLECSFRYLVDDQQVVRELEAGYPASRKDYDEWVRRHPPGTAVELRQALDNPTQVSGLSLLVPATTTAFASATLAMKLGLASLVLFLLSRMVVKVRAERAR